MSELNYPRWSTRHVARRLRQYAAYVGCGCYAKAGEPIDEIEHDPKSTVCARADFARLARELESRVSGHSISAAPRSRPRLSAAAGARGRARGPTPNKTGRSGGSK